MLVGKITEVRRQLNKMTREYDGRIVQLVIETENGQEYTAIPPHLPHVSNPDNQILVGMRIRFEILNSTRATVHNVHLL